MVAFVICCVVASIVFCVILFVRASCSMIDPKWNGVADDGNSYRKKPVIVQAVFYPEIVDGRVDSGVFYNEKQFSPSISLGVCKRRFKESVCLQHLKLSIMQRLAIDRSCDRGFIGLPRQ